MHRVRLGVCALIFAALGAASCAADDPAGGDPPGGAPESPAGTSDAMPDKTDSPDAAEVPEALSFQAATVDGGEFDAATLAGKPVAFWFWAAWCPRCAAAASDVAAVQTEYEGTAHVVGVAGLGSGADAMRDFVTQHELGGFPQLADDDGEVWRRFGVTTQEYFVVLDASGEIVHDGPLSADDLRTQLASLTG